MKHILLYLFIGVFLINCSDNDDKDNEGILHGSWSVTNISGGFVGMNQDFQSGEIIWTFDSSNATLQVANNNFNADVIYDGLDTGTYSYSILQKGEDKFLRIDGNEFGGIIFLDDDFFHQWEQKIHRFRCRWVFYKF